MSGINHSRRAFLRGSRPAQSVPLRPPGALPEHDFLAACTSCADCAKACPTQVIVIQDRYPIVGFADGACTFCGACQDTCATGALQRGTNAWTLKAQVSPACLAERGVECRICGEHCDAQAIRFSPRIGAPPAPVINEDACTGCGACVGPCPSQALRVAQPSC